MKETLQYIEDTCGWTRRGKNGREREKAGLIVACFAHGTARATPKTAAQVALDTRQAKERRPRAELFEKWQEVGRAHGFSTEHVNNLLMKQGPRPDVAERLDAAIGRAAERITESASHFSERDLIRFTAEEAQGEGLGAKEIRTAVRRVLEQSQEIVRLGTRNREERFTTKEMLQVEKKLLEQVDALASDRSHVLSEKAVGRVLSKRSTMSKEQADALRHITCRAGAVQVVRGLAGTGKTFLLDAAREAWERKGYTVIGAALSGKAAQGLQEEAEIRSTTLAKLIDAPGLDFKGDLEKGFVDDLKHHERQLLRAALGKGTWKPERLKLDGNTVLVVDEVSMVGTRQLQKLVEKVAKAGAKLVLVGDAAQLQSIEAGGAFKALGERHGTAKLTHIARPREAWARDAVQSIIRGDAHEALKMHADRGLLKVTDDRRSAMSALIDDWRIGGVKRPEEHLILASSNAEARALNELAQEERKAGKQLGTVHTKIGENYLYENDRVLFTRNSRAIGVKNGSLGTVIRVDLFEKRLVVCLDGGALVTVPLKEYDHIRLGYAMTTHKGGKKMAGIIIIGIIVLVLILGYVFSRGGTPWDPHQRGRRLVSFWEAERKAEKITRKGDPGIPWGGTFLPASAAITHCAVVGATRSGKTLTLRLLMQSVLRSIGAGRSHRALVSDSEKDMMSLLHGMGLRCPIKTLNPLDKRCVAWDIPAGVRTPEHGEPLHVLIVETCPAVARLAGGNPGLVRHALGEHSLRRNAAFRMDEMEPYAPLLLLPLVQPAQEPGELAAAVPADCGVENADFPHV